MSQSAQVRSTEAIEHFRAALCRYCEETRDALLSIKMEARRVVDWVERDRSSFWRKASRDRQEELAQAKLALFQRELSRLTGNKPDCIEQEKAVRQAKALAQEAEEKIANCKKWSRQLQHALDEFEGPAAQLSAIVDGDPPRPVLALDRILTALDAYLRLRAPQAE